MAAIRRHLPLITARIRFLEEICTEHSRTAHTTNFEYLEERHASVPPRQSSLAPAADDMTDGEYETASPSWIDYDDDDDIEMGGTVEDGEDRIGHRNEAGPGRITSNRAQSGKKISKPVGEAGRPNSGGYNLERKLKWDKEVFEEIKVGVPRYTHQAW